MSRRRTTLGPQGHDTEIVSLRLYVAGTEFRAGYADACAGKPMRDPGDAWEYEHGHQMAVSVAARGVDPRSLGAALQAQILGRLIDDGSLVP